MLSETWRGWCYVGRIRKRRQVLPRTKLSVGTIAASAQCSRCRMDFWGPLERSCFWSCRQFLPVRLQEHPTTEKWQKYQSPRRNCCHLAKSKINKQRKLPFTGEGKQWDTTVAKCLGDAVGYCLNTAIKNVQGFQGQMSLYTECFRIQTQNLLARSGNYILLCLYGSWHK